MAKLAYAGVLTLSLFGATAAYCAAFDCSKAQSDNEKLVCRDPELSADDDALAKAYRSARAIAPDQRAFAREADASWEWRERNCADRNCLLTWYARRTAYYLNSASTQPPQADASARPPAAIKVTAVQLWAQYSSNEIAADLKYKGHLVTVTGLVARVGRDLSGSAFVAIAADMYGYATVDAYFNENDPVDLAKIRRGQEITVTCYGAGLNLTNPILDCRR